MSKVETYRQEVMDAIEDLESAVRNCAWHNSDYYDGPTKDKTLRTALTALRRQIEPGWIKVSNRLPENQTAVLIWEPLWKNTYTAYWTGDQWHYFGGIGRIYETVTHWMPLPCPPNSSEE